MIKLKKLHKLLSAMFTIRKMGMKHLVSLLVIEV